MAKANIQDTTKKLKEKSIEILDNIKNVQDEVNESLQKVREIETKLVEEQKQQKIEKKQLERDALNAQRISAYVMQDDENAGEIIIKNQQANFEKPEKAQKPIEETATQAIIEKQPDEIKNTQEFKTERVETPENKKNEEIVDKKVVEKNETPIEKPVEKRVEEKIAETPAEKLSEAAVEKSAEAPVEKSVETPVQKLDSIVKVVLPTETKPVSKATGVFAEKNKKPAPRPVVAPKPIIAPPVAIQPETNEKAPEQQNPTEPTNATEDKPAFIYPFTSASGAKPTGTYVPISQRPRPAPAPFTPRPQGNGFAPRPQGTAGGFTPRPQGTGFTPRPQGGGGFAPRPQGTGFTPRPQGAGAGTAPKRPPAPLGKPSTYENKGNYQRNYDNDRRIKSKKSMDREAPPSINQDDEHYSWRKQRANKRVPQQKRPDPIKIEHAILTNELTSVKDLSEKIGKPAAELIKKLFLLGIITTINKEIDFDTCELIASEYNITLELKVKKQAEEVMLEEAEEKDDEANLIARPPVVTIMGHVDHGKTSLLDAIREARVTHGEAGGITQHIGAYTVELNGRVITFLDTPGHEAFTSMRARGAQATDIAILVVAADDGIKPQTIEAINHAQAAEVPIIVAINKIDKPDANIEKVKQQLTEHNLLIEEWGGDVIAVPVSAKTKENLDGLLETILLVADISEFKANPNRNAKGIIIEAELDKGSGPVATVLVKNGTLRIGDNIVAGTAYGRVRAMINDQGVRVDKALPGYPVEVLGFNEVPEAGDMMNVVDADKSRVVAEERKDKVKAAKIITKGQVSLDDLFNQIAEGEIKDLNIIIKADVQGSAEALKQSLQKLSNEEVRVRVIHDGVGAITQADIMLASASNAIVMGFNVRPNNKARDSATKEHIDVRMYSVIYSAIEDIEKALKGMLKPIYKENILGRCEVRDVFKITGSGIIAGSYVTDGKLVRNAQVRILRDSIVVHEGKISSLKRFKDDVKDVSAGYECGVSIEGYSEIKPLDVFEAFEMEEIKR